MYREDGISAGDRSLEVVIDSIATLEKLYGFFDEAGFTHRYSTGNGELEVSVHGQWLLFHVDRRVIEEEAMMDEAFEDARRIAEGYWNE